MSMMQAQKRQAAHHVAVYDLARQKSYGVSGLSGRAHRAFQNGADGALAWLDQPANNTAKNAVRLLRMYVNLIYENDGATWEVFQGQDIPDMITFWPLRGLVCETAARIWVRAQQWNATPAVGQAAVQGEEEVEIDAGDTGEDVVKKELAKLCWKYAHFAQDFARWMLIKGEDSHPHGPAKAKPLTSPSQSNHGAITKRSPTPRAASQQSRSTNNLNSFDKAM
ncbi:hypothetical protein J4E93_006400 [Alternaria ventricosa]|uniref:uncharacterized protein n=1 Tax=Alternaria ventricosa TaxID=1187951 RepID=UPI0020C4968A|nr:uncharacterized protein J4E93_006400 [Alternaria ventricosa]KAI4644495.1 hypothetical protein J4E93_006400 [Alternaria ventricosa]